MRPKKLHVVQNGETLCGKPARDRFGVPPWETTCHNCERVAESRGLPMLEEYCKPLVVEEIPTRMARILSWISVTFSGGNY